MTARRPLLPTVVILATLLASCAGRPNLSAARTALFDADRAFSHATTERRADGWVEHFADDGAMIRPTGTITGTAAIREAMTKTFADSNFSLTWEPQHADVGAAGDLGYTVGRYETRFRDAQGKAVVRTGRYLTVWKQQPGGTWKVVQDIGVPDAGPREPE